MFGKKKNRKADKMHQRAMKRGRALNRRDGLRGMSRAK
jgi:hypothetical protein